jgi:hypothetical protein
VRGAGRRESEVRVPCCAVCSFVCFVRSRIRESGVLRAPGRGTLRRRATPWSGGIQEKERVLGLGGASSGALLCAASYHSQARKDVEAAGHTRSGGRE